MVFLKSLLTGIVLAFSFQAIADSNQGKGEVLPFQASLFEKAKKENRKIVLHVTAPWCPVCRVQNQIIAELAKSHPDFLFFKIDYDSSGAILRPMNVSLQATILIFKGDKEVDRLHNVVNKDKIEAELQKVD